MCYGADNSKVQKVFLFFASEALYIATEMTFENLTVMKKLAEQHPSLDPQTIERVFVGRSGYDKNKIPKTSAAREARRWSH